MRDPHPGELRVGMDVPFTGSSPNSDSVFVSLESLLLCRSPGIARMRICRVDRSFCKHSLPTQLPSRNSPVDISSSLDPFDFLVFFFVSRSVDDQHARHAKLDSMLSAPIHRFSRGDLNCDDVHGSSSSIMLPSHLKIELHASLFCATPFGNSQRSP